MDPKIQELVEDYFKRPLTPEENQRLSQFLATSPEEAQRFAQRMEILTAREGTQAGASGEVALKDLPASPKDPPWAKTLFWVLLAVLATFLYWRFSSPLDREVTPLDHAGSPAGSQSAPKTDGPVKVFQARKSLPPPQISTPVPFKGDPKSQQAPSQH